MTPKEARACLRNEADTEPGRELLHQLGVDDPDRVDDHRAIEVAEQLVDLVLGRFSTASG